MILIISKKYDELIVSIIECLLFNLDFLCILHIVTEFILEKNLYDRRTMQILRKIWEFHSIWMLSLSLKHDYLTFYVIAYIAYPPSEKGKPKQPKNPFLSPIHQRFFPPICSFRLRIIVITNQCKVSRKRGSRSSPAR